MRDLHVDSETNVYIFQCFAADLLFPNVFFVTFCYCVITIMFEECPMSRIAGFFLLGPLVFLNQIFQQKTFWNKIDPAIMK